MRKKTSLILFFMIILLMTSAAAFHDDESSATVSWIEDGVIYTQESEESPSLLADDDNDEANLIPLSSPVDLIWGRDYIHTYEKNTGLAKEYNEISGAVSWTLGHLSQNIFRVAYYQKNSPRDVLVCSATWRLNYDLIETGLIWSDTHFLEEARATGDYYFTVQAIGDNEEYSSSPVATSNIWHYDAPVGEIPTPNSPIWERDRGISWEPCQNEYAAGYCLEFYYSTTLKSDLKNVGSAKFYRTQTDVWTKLPDWIVQEYGDGYYYVALKIYSKDITKILPSSFSQASAGLQVLDDKERLQAVTSSVDEESEDEAKQAAIDGVRAFGVEKLSAWMAADTDNRDTTANIIHLEGVVGTQTEVVVAEDLEEIFPTDSISVVGAGLNVNVGQKINLNIDMPSKKVIPPTIYQNTLQFSMELTDEEGYNISTTNRTLTVPIKITLPIPENIPAQFLVILHYHANNTYDEIRPYTYQRLSDGVTKWYATFVLKNFSDFTFAEKEADVTAERTEDGIQLTYFFPEILQIEYAYCAAYDDNDKVIKVARLPLANQAREFTIPCKEAAYIKVFTIDENYIPVSVAYSHHLRFA